MSKSKCENENHQLTESRLFWESAATTFDDEPDHGLLDPLVLKAWTALLETLLPSVPSMVLDVGCGTGSLSVVIASLGHEVTGIDLSPAMINLAKIKAYTKELDVKFQIMDASFPDFPPRQFNTIICRHLLWAIPEPDQVLQRWAKLLMPNGRCIMIEGFWETGAGLHANDVIKMLPSLFINSGVVNLSKNSDLWGRNVNDERYVIIADLHS